MSNTPTKSCNFHYGRELTDKEKQVVKIVDSCSYPITPTEVSALTKFKHATVRFYLRKLEKGGFVRRKYRGHYVSVKNVPTKSSSVVGAFGAVAPMLHSIRLRFVDVGLWPRSWVRVFGSVVKVTFTVYKNRSALVFVDCIGDVSLDYPAFRLVMDCIQKEVRSPNWASCRVTNFEFNYDFHGIKLDGVQGVTLKAFDGSFHRIYNKRFGLRDEVKVVGSKSVADVLALMQGGVSTYNIVQLLFANFQETKKYVEATQFQNRLVVDAVSQMRRLADAVSKRGDPGG
ncbi:hypothetical protein KAU88_05670 [Candidatus Bathyarchaeota archaeon]|nr:hypothetical protein [Candidatus Bathyarchaeota archaeon]